MAAITQSRDFAFAGRPTSCGGNFSPSHRLAGVYSGRVLKGEKASDLSVRQVTDIELFINVKAANARGLNRLAAAARPRRRRHRLGLSFALRALASARDAVNRSHPAMNSAAITGPMTKPLRPNVAMPPSVEISTK